MFIDVIFTGLLEPLFTKAFDTGEANPANSCV